MKQVISVFFALVILMSSLGITFSTHYCMGRAIDSRVTIGMHDLSCGMIEMEAKCEVDDLDLMAPGCCDNEFFSLEIEDDYQIDSHKLTPKIQFLFAYTYTFLFSQPYNNELLLARADHHPPPLEQDYFSLYQFFLL